MPRVQIIVDARGDLSAFDSLEAAEVALELTDVSNEECKVFEAEGSLLEATVTSDGLRVRLADSSPPELQPDEFAAVLLRFLSRPGAARTGLSEDECGGRTLRVRACCAMSSPWSRTRPARSWRRGAG